MDIGVRALNAAFMIAMPLALGVILARHYKLSWNLFLAGMGTFLGSQIFHIPFNIFLLGPILESWGIATTAGGVDLVLLGLSAGLSAGLFEEMARYIVYRIWLKEVEHWEQAVMFGAGHGGVESVLLGFVALYALFQAAAYRGVDLASFLSPEQVELMGAQLEIYWSAPWYAALLGALERAFALVIQVSLAVLVYQAVRRGERRWLLAAILWHTIIDALAVVAARAWGVYLAEAVIAALALLSLGWVLALRSARLRKGDGEVSAGHREVRGERRLLRPERLELSEKRLEESRFEDGL